MYDGHGKNKCDGLRDNVRVYGVLDQMWSSGRIKNQFQVNLGSRAAMMVLCNVSLVASSLVAA